MGECSTTEHRFGPDGSTRSKRALLLALGVGFWVVMTGCELAEQGRRELREALAEQERSAAGTTYARIPRSAASAAPSPEAGAASTAATRTELSPLPATDVPEGATPPAPISNAEILPALVEDDALAELIRAALQRNPDILAAVHTARSAAERIPQATALADPMVMTRTLPEPTRLADGNNTFSLGVQQEFPIPAKLDAAGRVALAELRMALADLTETRLRIIAQVKRAYFELFALDQAAAITKENQSLLGDLIEVARGQLVTGRRQQEDVLRAQVELFSLRSRLLELEQRRRTTKALINTLIDRPVESEVAAPAEYDIRRLDARLEALLAQAKEHNPELRQKDFQIERDGENLRQAQLGYWPNFNLGFEWMVMRPREAFRPPIDPQTGMRPAYDRMSEEGADNWAITFGFNIPIGFNRIEGAIHEARERLAASRKSLDAARNRIAYQIEDTLARIQAQREVAELYATAIIPQAEQAYRVTREGYVTGASDFQFVIDNWQQWLFFRIEYYRTLAELERGVADLEEAVGISVAEFKADSRPERNPPGIEQGDPREGVGP